MAVFRSSDMPQSGIWILSPIGRVFRKSLGHVFNLPTFAFEIVGDRVSQSGMDNGVSGIRQDRLVTPRQLVITLRTGLHDRKAMGDRVVDRLMVADLEMQERMLLGAAPVAAVETIGPYEIEGAGDVTAVALRHDE